MPAPHPLVFVHYRNVIALDPDTGQVRWKAEAPEIIVRMAFLDGRVFLLDRDCAVHVVDTATGRVLGMVQVMGAEKHGAAMIAEGNRIFVATTGGVMCLSSDGHVLWRTEHEGAGYGILPGLGLLGQIAQPDFNQG